MGSVNVQCATNNDEQPWTLQLTTPVDGKLSDTIVQLKAEIMEHINQCLAQQGSSLADDLDLMEETLSGDETPPKKHKPKSNSSQH